MWDNTIVAAIIGVCGTAAIATTADRIRLGTRVSLLEKQNEEKTEMLKNLTEDQKGQDKRLTNVEAVIAEIRSFVRSMEDVPKILTRLDTLIEVDRRSIRDLEGKFDHPL